MNTAPSTLRLPAEVAAVRELCEFATAPLDGSEQALAVHLALEEILVNIVRYGYAQDERGVIELTRAVECGILSVEIADSGRPFDPLQQRPPDLDAALPERSIGGLGIFLAKNIAAAVSYTRENGRNTLRLKFG